MTRILRLLPSLLFLPCLLNAEDNIGGKVGFSLGHETYFRALNDYSLINPQNVLDQKAANGNLLQGFSFLYNLPLGFHIQTETQARWLYWTDDTDVHSPDLNPYGFPGQAKFTIKSWELGWTSGDALLSAGAGKLLWEPGPAKLMKSANYFGWIFHDLEKTMAWAALTLEHLALKFVWAPRCDWTPESFAGDDRAILPGNSIYYTQFQLLFDSFDAGLFFAWDDDATGGVWFNLSVTRDFFLYGEGSWTNKRWIPVLDTADYAVDVTGKNGIRATLGLLYSPSFIDVSVYLEAGYRGDSYDSADWQALSSALDSTSSFPPDIRAGIYGQTASSLRYGYMDPFNVGIHVKPNQALFDLLDWSVSLIYGIPNGLYVRTTLILTLPFNLELHCYWDAPFVFGEGPIGNRAYPYGHKIEIDLCVRFWSDIIP
ncbi:MAG: hypothetical protein JXD23_10550 [Spirochaetales bacterium]|nr:hypothetical protein [Spirochaetales bacterium]